MRLHNPAILHRKSCWYSPTEVYRLGSRVGFAGYGCGWLRFTTKILRKYRIFVVTR